MSRRKRTFKGSSFTLKGSLNSFKGVNSLNDEFNQVSLLIRNKLTEGKQCEVVQFLDDLSLKYPLSVRTLNLKILIYGLIKDYSSVYKIYYYIINNDLDNINTYNSLLEVFSSALDSFDDYLIIGIIRKKINSDNIKVLLRAPKFSNNLEIVEYLDNFSLSNNLINPHSYNALI